MSSLNKVMLIGNLTRDPELRSTPKGMSVCQFGMAINRSYKEQDGALKEEVCFVDIEAWGKTGEVAAKYLIKGRPCFVEGRLKFEQWEDKLSSHKRNRLRVVAENIQLLGARPPQSSDSKDSAGELARTSAPASSGMRGAPDAEEPF